MRIQYNVSKLFIFYYTLRLSVLYICDTGKWSIVTKTWSILLHSYIFIVINSIVSMQHCNKNFKPLINFDKLKSAICFCCTTVAHLCYKNYMLFYTKRPITIFDEFIYLYAEHKSCLFDIAHDDINVPLNWYIMIVMILAYIYSL